MQRALDVKLVSSAERTQSLLFLKQRERAVKCSVYIIASLEGCGPFSAISDQPWMAEPQRLYQLYCVFLAL